jgi:DNA-binding FadR family transcriptional regulator
MAQRKLASSPRKSVGERSFSISRIKIPKAADVLASHLREDIVDGRLANGEMLPTERELAESSGLSRSSVREALRLLEIEGLLVTKPGRNGGSMVCQPSRETIVKTVSLYISSRKTQMTSLVEARMAIEPAAAMLAAKYRTDEDIAKIQDIQKTLEDNIHDLGTFLRANIDWHMAVVHASHNDLLIAFMESIAGSVYAVTNVESLNPLKVREQVTKVHARISAAIVSGDRDAAKRRMERHVDAYADHLGIKKPEAIAVV